MVFNWVDSSWYGKNIGFKNLLTAEINGDSFGDALEDQLKNIVIGAASNMAAGAIGKSYKSGDINKATQLALHAALGCAAGAAGGGDCASGAVSGVVGEMSGEMLKNQGVNKKTGIQLSGLIAGYSNIITGGLTGQSNSEIAENIYSGQRIGQNAAENNAYFAERPLNLKNKKLAEALSKIDAEFLDEQNIELVHEQLFFEDDQGGNIGFFSDSKFYQEEGKILDSYVKTKEGFDDGIMREAIENLSNKTRPYSLLGIGSCTGKYNCQDWSSDVRQEYFRIENRRDIEIWHNIINENR